MFKGNAIGIILVAVVVAGIACSSQERDLSTPEGRASAFLLCTAFLSGEITKQMYRPTSYKHQATFWMDADGRRAFKRDITKGVEGAWDALVRDDQYPKRVFVYFQAQKGTGGFGRYTAAFIVDAEECGLNSPRRLPVMLDITPD